MPSGALPAAHSAEAQEVLALWFDGELATTRGQLWREWFAGGPAFDEGVRRRFGALIARCGRFPHRNELLGRVSTAAGIAFLREPGSRL